jgi:hypothetical protein
LAYPHPYGQLGTGCRELNLTRGSCIHPYVVRDVRTSWSQLHSIADEFPSCNLYNFFGTIKDINDCLYLFSNVNNEYLIFKELVLE